MSSDVSAVRSRRLGLRAVAAAESRSHELRDEGEGDEIRNELLARERRERRGLGGGDRGMTEWCARVSE